MGLITKSDVASKFNSDVRSKITYRWDGNSKPSFGGRTASQAFSTAAPPSMAAGDVSSSSSVALGAEVVSSYVNFLNSNFKNIRNFRFYWHYTGDSSATIYNETGRALMGSGYNISVGAVSGDVTGVSNPASISNVGVTGLYNRWNSAVDANPVVLYETTSHSNHSSHGSRARR